MKILSLLLLLVSVSVSQAQLFTITNPEGNRSFDGTTGNLFTVGSSNIEITSLGFEDDDSDGLALSHNVAVWTTTGTQLALATVPAGTAGTLVNGYRYINLALPLTLISGTTYVIGARTTGATDRFTDLGSFNPGAGDFGPGSASIQFSSFITTGNPNLAFEFSTFTFPDMTAPSSPLRWAPANALFTAVPEASSSLASLAISIGIICSWRMRRRSEVAA